MRGSQAGRKGVRYRLRKEWAKVEEMKGRENE
jgi:hypothetical protein